MTALWPCMTPLTFVMSCPLVDDWSLFYFWFDRKVCPLNRACFRLNLYFSEIKWALSKVVGVSLTFYISQQCCIILISSIFFQYGATTACFSCHLITHEWENKRKKSTLNFCIWMKQIRWSVECCKAKVGGEPWMLRSSWQSARLTIRFCSQYLILSPFRQWTLNHVLSPVKCST